MASDCCHTCWPKKLFSLFISTFLSSFFSPSHNTLSSSRPRPPVAVTPIDLKKYSLSLYFHFLVFFFLHHTTHSPRHSLSLNQYKFKIQEKKISSNYSDIFWYMVLFFAIFLLNLFTRPLYTKVALNQVWIWVWERKWHFCFWFRKDFSNTEISWRRVNDDDDEAVGDDRR